MQIESFQAGNFAKGDGYSYFMPQPINHEWYWNDAKLSTLLEKASISLGELNSFARLVPDIDLFIYSHVMKEAVVSSRIEGTKTNMDEAFLPKEEILPEKRSDWAEIQNYTLAMNTAIRELEHLPLSSRLLCKTHEILLSGVRGENKMPGQFRQSQNWIGGATLNDAVFIPPAHHHIGNLMSDLENFLHNRDIDVPDLLRIAIAHYQFETIHPYLDGNGRIGRLMITLYLVDQKILNKPLLYLSSFFEKNKTLYYDNLTAVRTKNELNRWIKYFLIGIDETARKSADTLSNILKLKNDLESNLHKNAGRRGTTALKLLTTLFKTPVVNIKKVEETCSLSTKAANDLVNLFVKENILKEISGKTRNRTFLFYQYIELYQ